MTKDTQYPCYRWDAEGNAHRCETAADANPAWTDQHPSNCSVEKVVEPEVIPMSRVEIVTALNEGGIEFKKNSPTPALYKQLGYEVKAALTEAAIPFDDKADTKTLLGLLHPAE